MQARCDYEQNNEYYGCGHGGIITIILPFRTIVACHGYGRKSRKVTLLNEMSVSRPTLNDVR